MIGLILRYFRRRRARREYIHLTWMMAGCVQTAGFCYQMAAKHAGDEFEAGWLDQAGQAWRQHNELRDQRDALGVK